MNFWEKNIIASGKPSESAKKFLEKKLNISIENLTYGDLKESYRRRLSESKNEKDNLDLESNNVLFLKKK